MSKYVVPSSLGSPDPDTGVGAFVSTVYVVDQIWARLHETAVFGSPARLIEAALPPRSLTGKTTIPVVRASSAGYQVKSYSPLNSTATFSWNPALTQEWQLYDMASYRPTSYFWAIEDEALLDHPGTIVLPAPDDLSGRWVRSIPTVAPLPPWYKRLF